jgi:hypothetical protein
VSEHPPWVTCPAGSWTRIYNGLNWYGQLHIFTKDLALHTISYRAYSANYPYFWLADIVVPTGQRRPPVIFAPTPAIEFFINPRSPTTDFMAM